MGQTWVDADRSPPDPATSRQLPVQVPGAFDLFSRSSEPSTGRLDGALLLCRLGVFQRERPLPFATPDLWVELRLGDEAPYVFAGHANEAEVLITLPAVNLEPGAFISMRLFDRDFTHRDLIQPGVDPAGVDFITALRAPYPGELPWRGESDAGFFECRAPSPAAFDARLGAVLDRVRAPIGEIRRSAPEPSEPDFARPTRAAAAAEGVLFGVEALQGRDAVEPHRQEIRQAEVDWSQRLLKSLAAVAKRQRSKGGWTRVGRLWLRPIPDPRELACVVRLQARRPDEIYDILGATMVFEDGSVQELGATWYGPSRLTGERSFTSRTDDQQRCARAAAPVWVRVHTEEGLLVFPLGKHAHR